MKITIKNGDLSSLLGVLSKIWGDILPPNRSKVISCAVVKDENNIETLLLFNNDELESREFVGKCKNGGDFLEVVDFIQNWIMNDKSLPEPPTAYGGSYFKGFWLSNEDLETHDHATPFLAIRSAWPFYEQ